MVGLKDGREMPKSQSEGTKEFQHGTKGKLKRYMPQTMKIYKHLRGLLSGTTEKMPQLDEPQFDFMMESCEENFSASDSCIEINPSAEKAPSDVPDLVKIKASPKGPSLARTSSTGSIRECGQNTNLSSFKFRFFAEVASCTTFSEAQLNEATDGFSSSHMLGRGSFGAVYWGEIYGTPVAIKRLFNSNVEKSGFKTELEVLSRIRHPNIVLLMGFCPHAPHPCLVFEFLSGGNLQQRLECKNNAPPLSWSHRIRIACELAGALLFLHHQVPAVIHRDLKPENVMLDEDGKCKIVDAGMAIEHDHSEIFTSAAVGTLGYIDPELMNTGRVTRSSDVYSFGLILVQLITGIPVIKHACEDLTSIIAEAEKVKVEQQLDDDEVPPAEKSSLRAQLEKIFRRAAKLLVRKLDQSAGSWPMEIAEQVAYIAVRCSSRSLKYRATIKGAHSALMRCKEASQDST